MLLAVHYRVMEHLGSLESTQEARVALGYASGNSYASFVLSKLPACSITRWWTLKHEPIVKHFSKICRQPKCPVLNCGKRHHKLLHSQPLITATRSPTNTTLTGLAASKSPSTMKETLLQTALAKLSVNGQEVTVRVLLDSGSQRSYIHKKHCRIHWSARSLRSIKYCNTRRRN